MENKICTKCKNEKKLDSFNKNKTKKDGYCNVCRSCSNAVSKLYYETNIDKHKGSVKIRNRKVRLENRERYFKILSQSSCIDCGNDNPLVLEYDHKDGVIKNKGVGELVGNGTCWETIEKEIDKCDLRCANCHRIRTAKQQNWYKEFMTH